MKISSAGQGQPPVERSKAWSCLVTNLLVFPGLGSVMVGHRWSGYGQMLLALLGSLLAVAAVVKIALEWVKAFQWPDQPGLYHAVIAGLGALLLSWIWSLLTSIIVLRRAPRPPPVSRTK